MKNDREICHGILLLVIMMVVLLVSYYIISQAEPHMRVVHTIENGRIVDADTTMYYEWSDLLWFYK